MASSDAPPKVDTPVEENQSEGGKLRIFIGILKK